METKNTIEEGSKVIVEKTSKKLKKQQLISALILILGLILMFAVNPIVGSVVSAAGVVMVIYTKIQIWWHHE